MPKGRKEKKKAFVYYFDVTKLFRYQLDFADLLQFLQMQVLLFKGSCIKPNL